MQDRIPLAAWPISGRDTLSQRVTNMLGDLTRTQLTTQPGKKRCSWGVERQIDPLSATLADVLDFVTDNFVSGLQYPTLNTLCSAISMTHAKLDNCTVGTHPTVTRLLKGKFNATPRYSHSWEVKSVLNSLGRPSEKLSLLLNQLSKKVVTLMAWCNADNCSDLAALHSMDFFRCAIFCCPAD